ncbi:MAG: GHKL domain-containing protein [Lachnospiraceae bacterium]|nr:GHKL domain-containing protein [Lachnospiraceae bacterium]
MAANFFFLKSYYLLNKKRNINDAYRFLDEASKNKKLMTPEFRQSLMILCEVNDISVVVLDNSNNVLASVSSDDKTLINQLSNNFLVDQLASKEGGSHFQTVHDSNSGNKYLELWGTLYNNEKFMIRCALVAVEDSVLIANKFLLIVGLIGMFMGCTTVIIITNRITRPLLKLTEISSKVSNLEFDTKYDCKGINEIDILGYNINNMSEKLEQTISELKCANNALLQDLQKRDAMEDMRKEFVSNVSHELKTPIALIQSYSEGLKEGIMDDEESRNYYLDVIIDESNRMNRLVKELMSLSELEFGNNQLEIERFDIVELLNNKIASSNLLLKQNEINLEFENADESIYVWSDEFRTEEVIQNYLSNAIHYCSKEKIIKLFIEKKEDTVRINIFNTGENIKDEDMEHIWDKFYKADKARSRDYGGTGIGLSIVKAIMTSYNMDYGCENKNNGVNFYFELPIN